ncbi:MAG: glycerol-3-phosphate 1-O-acyltransferase PlsY [Candidatus Eremiobacteraeota bacterium]|nr:glycerol-3-phosphate 1-O-acyltransferase PlsY [Candidatus Eremiobacteraeota bacterium]MBV8498835.1 glycerol-3-phosphate 1-O-acyltransferase PlsY [Candidatus Eremiobacteraeota bacterium]
MSDIGISNSVAVALTLVLVAIVVATFAGAFLIGSIPFGYIIGRIFYGTDIRGRGSGNIGAMNALRTLGVAGAIAVLLLDALKGFAPTLWAQDFFRGHLDMSGEGFPPTDQLMGSLAATGAVLGHCFSPWLRFRGGKGVATSFGAVFALCWPAGIAAVAGWIVGAASTRYSSVGSLLGSVLAPIAIYGFTRSLPETAYGIIAALIIFVRHRDNIARLCAGTESPIGKGSRSRGPYSQHP